MFALGTVSSFLAMASGAAGAVPGGGADPDTPLPFYAIVYHPDEQVFWIDLNQLDPDAPPGPDPSAQVPEWALATNGMFRVDELLAGVSDYIVGPDDLLGDLDLDGAVTMEEVVELVSLLATPVGLPRAVEHGGDDGPEKSLHGPPLDAPCPIEIICAAARSSEVCVPPDDPLWGSCIQGCPRSDPCCGVDCDACYHCENGSCTRDSNSCCGVLCLPCRRCDNGSCVQADPCCGIDCGKCWTCNNGQCERVHCCSVECPDCESCGEGGYCEEDDLYCNVTCPECSVCRLGECIQTDPCCGVDCPPCYVCEYGNCVKHDPCCGVDCEDCFSCQNGSCESDPNCCGVTCGACQRCVDGVCHGRCAPGHSCCGGRCCAPGTSCCGSEVCCPTGANCCENGECCWQECEGCIDPGELSGGIIEVEPPVVCIGDTITFTASGVEDS